jgi:hypothetical protein
MKRPADGEPPSMAKAIDVTEGGRVEHVHRRIRRQQRVEDRSIGPIPGEQESRHARLVARGGERRFRADDLGDPDGVAFRHRHDQLGSVRHAAEGTTVAGTRVRCGCPSPLEE